MDDLVHSAADCPDPLGIHCWDGSKIIVRRIVGRPTRDPEEIGDFGLVAGEPLSLVEQIRKAEGQYLGWKP